LQARVVPVSFVSSFKTNRIMEFKDIKEEEKDQKKDEESWGRQRGRGGRIFAGLLIVIVGGALLLQRLDYWIFPYWLFTWPMILIVIGLFVGVRSGFRFFGSFIMIGVGSVFLLQEIFTGLSIDRFIWPVVLITIGLSFIFGRHRHGHGCGGGRRHRIKDRLKDQWGDQWREKWEKTKKDRAYWHDWKKEMYDPGHTTSTGDLLDINAVFGSVKRIVLSKDFRGGEINTVMGGCELNLIQADITGRAVLEVNTVFGGTRIMVPPNWLVHLEMDSVFGGLEDKRPTHLLNPNPEKVLVLKGSTVFGGTELDLG
jgi:predicted membrane protein